MTFVSRKIIIIISILVLIGSGFAALSKLDSDRKSKPVRPENALLTKVNTQLIRHESGAMVLEWEFPDAIIERDPEAGHVSGFDMPGAEPHFAAGLPRMPRVVQLLDCLPGHAAVQIIEVEAATHDFGPMRAAPPDVPVDPRPTGGDADGEYQRQDDATERPRPDEIARLVALRRGLWPEQAVMLDEAGVFRGHRLLALSIYPVQVDAAAGIARVIRRVRVRVTLPRSETAGARLPDSPAETALLQRLLGTLGETALPTRTAEAFTGRGSDGRLDDPVGGRWKLLVRTEGIVRVTGADLRFAGCPLETITAHDTHIKNRGREIPIQFVGGADGRFDDNDYILFYGIPNRQTYQWSAPTLYTDPFTDDNVYWLSWGDGRPGIRLGEEDGTWRTGYLWAPPRVITVNNVRAKVHFEKDRVYDRLAKSISNWSARLATMGPMGVWEDHAYWDDRIDAYSSRDYIVGVPYPDPRSFNNVVIRAALQGYSDGHHRAIVSLNNLTAPGLAAGKESVGDTNTAWTGQTAVIVQSQPGEVGIRSGVLPHGNNVFTITLPGTGLSGSADRVFTNWFELEYDREMRAFQGFIAFRFDTTRADTFAFDIRGFISRDINVWRLGVSRMANLDVRYVSPTDESASWAVRFQMISDGAYEMVAFDDRHPRPPFAIEPETSTRDLRALTGAQYLLIYHDSFADDLSQRAISDLLNLRLASFSGSADTVRVSQIYEQFNDGIVNPEAIHRFLKYGYEHWPVRPTHACLVGDGLVAARVTNQPGNLISSFYPPTYDFGIAASDLLFGTVSGPPWDIFPDVAVGRISCRSADELQTYVRKVVRYESPDSSDYNSAFHSKIMFVSDAKDGGWRPPPETPSRTFNFDKDFSEPTARHLPDYINLARVYLDSLPLGQGRNALRDALRDGAVFVNYNGHGGGGLWSGTELMNVAGTYSLTNNRTYPFISNFTCYVGAFDAQYQTPHPSGVLGEAFIFAKNNRGDPVGAIGVYSSSGVGWANAGLVMQIPLFDFALDPPGLTIGEIVQINKIRYWSGRAFSITDSPYAMMLMMNLLGDPGVRLRLPQQLWHDFAADTNIVAPGDSIYVSGTLPWDPAGNITDVYIIPYNGNFSTLDVYRSLPFVTYRTKVPTHDLDILIGQPVRERVFGPLAVPVSQATGNPLVATLSHVVVYAVDPVGKRDAIGTLPLYHADSLRDARVADIDVVPGGYIYADSAFRVEATILHRDGVQSVRARGVFRPAQGPVELDTVDMAQVSPGRWRTPPLGPHSTAGGTYRMQFLARPYDGEFIDAGSYDLPLEGLWEFYLSQLTNVQPEMRPGPQPQFRLPIFVSRLSSSRDLELLTVAMNAVSDSAGTVLDSFTTTVAIHNPSGDVNPFEVFIPAPLRALPYRLTFMLDPENRIPERNEGNNTRMIMQGVSQLYPATNAIGTYQPRTNPPETAFHRYYQSGTRDTLFLRLLPGSLPADSATLIYRGPTALPAAEAAGLETGGIRAPVSGQPIWVCGVSLTDSSERLPSGARARIERTFPASLTLPVEAVGDSAVQSLRRDLERTYSVFVNSKESSYWQRLENTEAVLRITIRDIDTVFVDRPFPLPDTIRIDTTFQIRPLRMAGESVTLGRCALFRVADNRGPNIEFAVNGMRFTRNSILPRRPEIYATISDFSGVDLRPGKFYFVLNGDTLPAAEIAWSDTAFSPGRASAIIRPELEPGVHHMHVFATDNTGLSDTLSATFEVRGEFGIEWAINYPNPFRNATLISYVVTDVTDDFVEIRIFTVSGRHIRTLREVERGVANYREIRWDGRDFKGEEVANGVYFARLKAKYGDQEVEKTIKLAKVR